MGFTSFIASHTFGIGVFVILLGLTWKFIIQPRLGMTDSEVRDKLEDSMEQITKGLTVNPEDIMDESSMPSFSKQKTSAIIDKSSMPSFPK